MERSNVIVEPNELREFRSVHLIIGEGDADCIAKRKGQKQAKADAKRSDEKSTRYGIGGLFPFCAGKACPFHGLVQILSDFGFHSFQEFVDGNAVFGIIRGEFRRKGVVGQFFPLCRCQNASILP